MIWLVLAAFALWLLYRSKKPRPARRDIDAAEREARSTNDALAEYRYSDESAATKKSYHYRTLIFHFPKMLAFETDVSRYAGGEETRAFRLRRVDAIKWQMKRVAENAAAGEAAALKRDADRDSDSLIDDDLINELNGPQSWFDVEEPAVASLEAQYQRFLMHWRPPT